MVAVDRAPVVEAGAGAEADAAPEEAEEACKSTAWTPLPPSTPLPLQSQSPGCLLSGGLKRSRS